MYWRLELPHVPTGRYWYKKVGTTSIHNNMVDVLMARPAPKFVYQGPSLVPTQP